jgi:cardiolipin synthase
MPILSEHSLTWWRTLIGLLLGYGATLILIRWVILTRRRQPTSTVAWILSIILLPYVGGLLFLFFGINRVQRRKRRIRTARESIGRRLPHHDPHHAAADKLSALNVTQQRIASLTRRIETSPIVTGNRIEVLNDTNIILRRIEEAVLSAKDSIHLEYYIWQPDKTGMRLRDLIVERARQGIHVRFLYDGLGSLALTRRFLAPLIAEKGIAAPFVPGRTFRERWSFNLRSHRKIVVVDGRIGFTGGMNIGDEYLGRKKSLGYWRDTHLEIEGPCVNQLQRVFAEDWYYATGEELLAPQFFPPTHSAGSVMAQIISGGPDGNLREFHTLMFSAINDAQNQILLTTSYFVPTESLLAALCSAAMRGVRVRLLLPAKSDHWFVVYAGRSYFEELLDAGVEIYEYRRGILHAKTLTIDGCWSLVGSPNFDPRSLLLNFEVGAAMFDEGIATTLEDQFEKDLVHARRIDRDEWLKRPTRQIFWENACRLFSPVL